MLRQGGYQGAERNILLFLPDWMEPETRRRAPSGVCGRPSGRRTSLSHRDILGSLMGMGIVREKVGDILVGPESADLMVLDTVAEFLLLQLEQRRPGAAGGDGDPRRPPPHPGGAV